MTTAKSARRSRPLRCEDPEQLFFVTTRTIEEVFWLDPLLCSRLAPMNREARRVVDARNGGNVPPFLPAQRGERATVFAQTPESTGNPTTR
ncbi:MAG: hypothetical protein MUE69_02390 [Myxococcota bacterium]|jgi:hypothetical protein|nr:hypothetical protein [Myxococcota bacterium]